MDDRVFWHEFFSFVSGLERRAERRGAYLARLGASLEAPTEELQAAVEANSADLPGSPYSPRKTLLRSKNMASPTIADLTLDVTNAKTVMSSATTLIGGFQQRLDDGIAAALANGATASELAPLQVLSDELQAETALLSAAVEANTPSAPPAAPKSKP
jgi:hypothetical protein